MNSEFKNIIQEIIKNADYSQLLYATGLINEKIKLYETSYTYTENNLIEHLSILEKCYAKNKSMLILKKINYFLSNENLNSHISNSHNFEFIINIINKFLNNIPSYNQIIKDINKRYWYADIFDTSEWNINFSILL